MAISSLLASGHTPAFNPVRGFITFTLQQRMFDLLADWFSKRKGWAASSVRRLGFDVAPLPDSDQGLDPVYFRMKTVAAQLRDSEIFAFTPRLRTKRCINHQFDLAAFLNREMLAHPDDEVLFEMVRSYYLEHPITLEYRYKLLEKSVEALHLELVKKILTSFPDIPSDQKRQYLHYPFDYSVVADPDGKRICRELMTLLDPTFEIPKWLMEI